MKKKTLESLKLEMYKTNFKISSIIGGKDKPNSCTATGSPACDEDVDTNGQTDGKSINDLTNDCPGGIPAVKKFYIKFG